MSTQPITFQPTAPVAAPARTTSPSRTTAPAATAATTGESVTVDTMPASPPPDVLAEMATAAGAQDRLAASGQAMHFSIEPSTGSLSVQVTDLQGNVLGTVAPSAALHVAGGGTLE